MTQPEPKEKKVEYIELIYDLIFVYVIGRNNALLHIFENGFVAPPAFLAYLLTTLAVIQIWTFSTYYINIYGRKSIREHVFLFVNMFLLYFIGKGTRADWQAFHTQYHVAWALILVNTGMQYLFELRSRRKEDRGLTLQMAAILLAEALIVLADIPVYRVTQMPWLSFAAVLFGMGAVLLCGRGRSGELVEFPHLSERAMLYVVFTFGEMIIAIASYFDGTASVRSLYFALMAFLIVVGLFLSYGLFYDRIIEREMRTNGLWYMLLHIFLIFAMNNITNSLEFMREEEIRLLPKILFLIGSFLLFFGVLLALGRRHAKTQLQGYGRLCGFAALTGAVFAVLVFLLRTEMVINIALSVAYVFVMFLRIFRFGKQEGA